MSDSNSSISSKEQRPPGGLGAYPGLVGRYGAEQLEYPGGARRPLLLLGWPTLAAAAFL